MIDGGDYAVVLLAALAAGLVNALAGGGTLISFPTLTAVGLPALAANVTNTIALCPGFLGGTLAQASDLRGQRRRLCVVIPASVLGGVAGGVLLLASGERLFRVLVPYLMLAACVLLAVQPHLRRWLVHRLERAGRQPEHEIRAGVVVGLAATYGGYFGAGLGVILLATVGLVVDDTLTRLNALKQVIALSTNLAAAVFFAFSGQVVWPVALVMALGALAGGSIGGRIAGRVSPTALRVIVVVVGLAAATTYLVRP